MKERILVGLVALPAVLIPIWLGGVWLTLFLMLVGIGGGLEFYRLMQIGGYQPRRTLGLVWLALLILSHWQPQLLPFSLVVMAGMIITLIDAMHQKQAPMHTWMATSMGALYIGTMLGQALALRQLPNGMWWVLLGLALTWTNDSAAYFVGVTFGRHKLWPRLSPKKSWEGTIAGWVTAAIVGALWIMITPLNAAYSPILGAVVGLIAGILALFGDLAISTLKRQVGVKDSGHIFPGHGGVLDRLDSILFVLPFVYQVVSLWH
ncbi:MAG: phosphatidate cytidylyltransferase [Caldilineaceae bacterium]|nr:phosphatidate cytidylyltransferase [Caldilineaceae bacterium]